jgi:hypothetical protein
MMWAIPTLVASMLAACASLPPSGPVIGQWGGPHIGLTLTEAGGAIEYDCAAGRLTEPLVPGPGGRFELAGLHTPGHGGPAIEGQVMPTHRVRFSGNLRGDRMSLTGRVENGVLLGPFELRRGAEPGTFRCL